MLFTKEFPFSAIDESFFPIVVDEGSLIVLSQAAGAMVYKGQPVLADDSLDAASVEVDRGVTVTDFMFHSKGPSIKYVTLFFANFDPPSLCHTLSHIPGPSPKKYVTYLEPPIFRRPSTKNVYKNPLYKFSLNCSRGFLSGGLSGGL